MDFCFASVFCFLKDLLLNGLFIKILQNVAILTEKFSGRFLLKCLEN